MSDPITYASITYLLRKNKQAWPDGHRDSGSRWYPSKAEQACCCHSIRQPSRSFPMSLQDHCQSLKHVCNLYKVNEEEVRFRIKKELPLLMGSGNAWLDKWLEQKFRQE